MENCTIDIPDDSGKSNKNNDSGLACRGKQKSIQRHTGEQTNDTINTGVAAHRRYFKENTERKLSMNNWFVNRTAPTFECIEE
ncbi:hypothetical protein BGZ51_002418 [Haplosporangium sp. Z 767]|nr:hypothetical protein BGZ51_002418 [Haplosporangium sp. Z 767]